MHRASYYVHFYFSQQFTAQVNSLTIQHRISQLWLLQSHHYQNPETKNPVYIYIYTCGYLALFLSSPCFWTWDRKLDESMLNLHGEFWMRPLQVKIYVTPHAWFSVQSGIRNEYTTNSGINSTCHTLCALGAFAGVHRALALIHDTWSAVNFCATLQVIRNKTVRMRILEACQMIRLGAVIWTAQDH